MADETLRRTETAVCAACGGPLVRTGSVHGVFATKITWERLECPRCAERQASVDHAPDCFCPRCLH